VLYCTPGADADAAVAAAVGAALTRERAATAEAMRLRDALALSRQALLDARAEGARLDDEARKLRRTLERLHRAGTVVSSLTDEHKLALIEVFWPGLGVEAGDELVVASDPGLAGKTVSARIATFADHRIAMSFALAGLMIPGVVIEDPGSTAKTFPGYWDALAGLGVELRFGEGEPG
jgi:hypothetical protein